MNRKRGLNAKVALVVTISVFGAIVASRAAAPADGDRVRRADAGIKADVERTLSSDRLLAESRIVVKSVRNGVVLLSGNAASSNDNVHALRSTADRRGVRKVFSEIESYDVVPAPPVASPVAIPINAGPLVQHDPVPTADDVIRRDVEAALNDLDARDNADIHVQVTEGVVRLTGSVPTWRGNSARLEAARSVTGVRSIINGLRIAMLSADRR